MQLRISYLLRSFEIGKTCYHYHEYLISNIIHGIIYCLKVVPFIHWVTLSFAETKVSNFSLRPKVEVCTGITQIPQEWEQMPREYCGYGNWSYGNPVGMKFVSAGTPLDALEILLMIKIQVQALKYPVNCPMKCLTWLLNM